MEPDHTRAGYVLFVVAEFAISDTAHVQQDCFGLDSPFWLRNDAGDGVTSRIA